VSANVQATLQQDVKGQGGGSCADNVAQVLTEFILAFFFLNPVVTICTTSLTFINSTFCPQCICVFCMDLRTNSVYFLIQH